MPRRAINCGILSLLVGAGLLDACAPDPGPRPNVLLISIDTIRHDFVGSYGAPTGPTPALDRLAGRGVLFENAIATSSWTLPSHMSLLTGQYPASHGVNVDGRALIEEKATLAEFLSDRGYRTGGFVAGPYLHRAYGFDQGFDDYVHCVRWGEELNDRGLIKNVIGTNLRSHQGVTSPATHERVIEWLAQVPRSQPWFLFVHYWDPHYDFTPPPPYDRYLDPGYSGRLTGNGFLQNPRVASDMSSGERKRLLDLYRGEIRFTDYWIDRLLRRIEERGDLDETLVVVVGDHGEEFFEHGNKGHRRNLYEETLRVPMILHLPGTFEGGRVVSEPVSLIDVFPTVASRVTTERSPEVMGVDLGSGSFSQRPGVVAELFGRHVALRGSRWKLILDHQSEEIELYSLAKDPGESTEMSVAAPEQYERLAAILAAGDYARFAPSLVAEAELDTATVEALRALGYAD
jgi:arylsulfatase